MQHTRQQAAGEELRRLQAENAALRQQMDLRGPVPLGPAVEQPLGGPAVFVQGPVGVAGGPDVAVAQQNVGDVNGQVAGVR